MIARITCSMMSRLTPRSWMRRIRPMISSISVGFSPAMTSSSSSSSGPGGEPAGHLQALAVGQGEVAGGHVTARPEPDEIHDLRGLPASRRRRRAPG